MKVIGTLTAFPSIMAVVIVVMYDMMSQKAVNQDCQLDPLQYLNKSVLKTNISFGGWPLLATVYFLAFCRDELASVLAATVPC